MKNALSLSKSEIFFLGQVHITHLDTKSLWLQVCAGADRGWRLKGGGLYSGGSNSNRWSFSMLFFFLYTRGLDAKLDNVF